MRSSTYYHATRKELTLRAGMLCVTPDRIAAEAYLEGESGHVYEIALRDGLSLADEDLVVELARDLCPDSPYLPAARAYELLEEERVVREALIELGYDGVTYTDETPENAMQHDTVLVFNAMTAVRHTVAA